MTTTITTVNKYPPQNNNIIKTTIILKPTIPFKTTATTRVSNQYKTESYSSKKLES